MIPVDRQYHVLAGRTGVVAAVIVFVAAYIYGLLTFGPLLGIAFGWLPCGIVAWLTLMVVTPLTAHVAPRLTTAWLQLTSLIRFVVLRFQHRN
jgi:hypothetical protein